MSGLVVSILVTFTALVLSLMLSEVKGTFDTFDARLRSFAGDISNLDIHLREYGPEAEPIRATIKSTWRRRSPTAGATSQRPSGDFPRFDGPAASSGRSSARFSSRPTPQFTNWTRPTISANGSRIRCQIRSTKRLRARRQLLETSHDTISWPLMVAMCAWLAVVFGVFGLLSPRNAVVYLSIVICAICVASAIFLIDDFDSPIDGLLSAPSDSMRATLSQNGRALKSRPNFLRGARE